MAKPPTRPKTRATTADPRLKVFTESIKKLNGAVALICLQCGSGALKHEEYLDEVVCAGCGTKSVWPAETLGLVPRAAYGEAKRALEDGANVPTHEPAKR